MMQFDQSFLAIRARSVSELFDLSLQVVREYWWQLAILLACAALPLSMIDYVLLSWFLNGREDEFLTSPEGWIWLFLIFSQSQLGTCFLTHFLGQAVFRDRPGIRESLVAVARRFWGLIWLQGLLRGIVFFWLPLLMTKQTASFDRSPEVLGWYVFFSILFGLVRLGRPFVTEVWLLERPAFRVKNPKEEISFGKRSAALHAGILGEFFGRSIQFGFFGGGLLAGLYLATHRLLQISSLAPGNLRIQEIALWVGSLWVVFGFLAIVRLLTYLDLRIRQEGWDVELLIRAEAYRLQE